MHNHPFQEKEDSTAGNLKFAFWLNTFFAIIEVAGGIATNSIAVLSDALHDAGDSIALGVAWYFHRISGKKPDGIYSFGYKRFSVLGALINAIILFSGSCIILVESIPRIISPQPVHSGGMFLLAILGILINGYAVFKIRRGRTQNERVISLHLLEDVLGWTAVLVTSITIHFADIPVLDPILSVGITLFILFRLFTNLRKTFRILLQGTPSQLEIERIRKCLLLIPPIDGVHDLRIWTMDDIYHVATLHIEVSKELSLKESEELKTRIRKELKLHDIEHATLEIELKGQDCILNEC